MPFSGGLILVIVVFALQLTDCATTLSGIGLLQAQSDQSRYQKGPAIVYSPYWENGCKPAEVMAEEVERLKGVSTIRIYGSDCDQIKVILKATKNIGAKLMVGVWDIANIGNELNKIVEDIGGDWMYIDTVAVGNELVDQRKYTANAVVAAVKKTRARLEEAGWNGVPIVTVDTWVAIRDNPILCQNSDYIAANAHPYFDGNVEAGGSGKFLEDTVTKVLSELGDCKGKSVRITETGWPSAGMPNNKAQAGLAQQKAAIESMVKSTKGNLIILSAYDETWKYDGGLQIEKHWGIDKILQDVLKAAD